MDLSIIIVNYNTKYFLEQCLCSVKKACKNITAEILVVDNNSDDGSRDYLESKFPKVIFKWKQENEGFAKANNSVLDLVNGEFVLFLNPDTILPEDCFEKCIDFFRMRETCGALGVRMIDGSGNFLRESKRCFPGAAASFYKMSGLANMFPSSKTFSKYYAAHLPEKEINETEMLAGAFLMMRKKTLDITGGFDERFFMYAEDIDLSCRVQKAGYKNYYFPVVTIVHFKGESTQKQSKKYIQRFYGAMQLFVKKYYANKMIAGVLMQGAIGFGQMISYIKLFFGQMFSGNNSASPGNPETIVLAGQSYFNEMIQLIKYAKEPLVIQGRVSLKSNDKEAAIGVLDDLGDIVLKNKTGKIIFCEDPLSFKSMIEIMDELKGKTAFLFHAKKSESIVGSNNKNEKGIFIARE